jgi:uncharacterized Tic20 family protein
MSSMRACLLLILACAAIAGDAGIQVQAISPWSDPYGYTPVIVRVSAARAVELDVRIAAFGPSARTVIRVGDAQEVRQTVLLPPANSRWFSVHELTWRDTSGATGSTSIGGRGHGHDSVRALLIDPAQEVALPKVNERLNKQVSPRSSTRGDMLDRLAVDDLPDRWQAFPEWLVLVLTPRGDAALSDTQRAALVTWVAGGGRLVLSTPALQRAWQSLGLAVAHDPLTGDSRQLGEVINRLSGNDNWEPSSHPVPGTEHVPVKSFVTLALLFAIIVGPLNLWWVRRRNARHLFLITTPAISLVTCVALIVASLFADGVSVRRSAVQVCLIDHRTQHVVRWTGATYFAAFSQSSLALDTQAKVRVLDPEDYDQSSYRRSYPGANGFSLDWRQGQLLGGGLIPARINRQLAYIEHLPERRRLVVERDGEGWRLTNGLGVALRGAAWRDERGGLWTAGALDAGGSAPLAADNDALLPFGTGTFALASGLPPGVVGRLGRDADLAVDRVLDQPHTFAATLQAPMDDLPGPSAIDAQPPLVVAVGHLPPGGARVEAP